MEELIRELREGGYSCVIRNGDERLCSRSAALPILTTFCSTMPHFLRGAWVADKVVGKGGRVADDTRRCGTTPYRCDKHSGGGTCRSKRHGDTFDEQDAAYNQPCA